METHTLGNYMPIKNLDKKYGRLTILGEHRDRHKNGVSVRIVECICDCGVYTEVHKNKILRGVTKSCGCLREDTYKKWADKRRLNFGEAALNQVYGVYKKCALTRNYEFNLSRDEFEEIVTKPCIYCGSSLTNKLDKSDGYGHFEYTGIDRYDNSIGYTIENSVPCCKICNRIKTDMDINVLYNHINKMMDNAHLWRA